MKTSDFDYQLPEKYIAQNPVSPRDSSKLMVFDTASGNVMHKHFYDLPEFLVAGDVLVLNRSKVIPARVVFDIDDRKKEVFILKKLNSNKWHVLVKPGNFFKLGISFDISKGCSAKVLEVCDDGSRIIEAHFDLMNFGVTPLPPYIKHSESKDSQYQTVYAKENGSVAAPTAGLHFTSKLLNNLKSNGVDIEEVVLHVGRGTFLPVSAPLLTEHVMHSEEFEMPVATAKSLNEAIIDGRRVVAVGTTSVRVLESSFHDKFISGVSSTNIFIYPGYEWKVVGALITNFHLPKSTLVMLVASFLAGKGITKPIDRVLELYELAKEKDYRFYSFGDAMLIF